MFSVVSEVEAGFAGFGLNPAVLSGVSAAGFKTPRPIQSKAIPAALQGRDVLGLAHTGTGKTAAFALPILNRMAGGRSGDPRALIIAPTRELANQICQEIRTLARYTQLRVATLIGGVSASQQIAELRKRPEMIVACPGRLLDLMQQGFVRLDRIETLVLDEADHMFDMGFLPDIRRILAALPANRQNLLFSATMPDEIRHLADGLLRDPLAIELSHSRPVPTVSHAAYSTDSRQKYRLLELVLSESDCASAIVFTRTKHRARRLAQDLERSGRRAVALQGNMSQPQRVKAMEGFRKGHFNVLVATDIAARGIDVEGVSHVVNFDMPDTADSYTHRIGRTGRAGETGKAVSFITLEDRPVVRAIEERIGEPIPRWAVEEFSGDVVITQLAAEKSSSFGTAAPTRVRSFSPRKSRWGIAGRKAS